MVILRSWVADPSKVRTSSQGHADGNVWGRWSVTLWILARQATCCCLLSSWAPVPHTAHRSPEPSVRPRALLRPAYNGCYGYFQHCGTWARSDFSQPLSSPFPLLLGRLWGTESAAPLGFLPCATGRLRSGGGSAAVPTCLYSSVKNSWKGPFVLTVEQVGIPAHPFYSITECNGINILWLWRKLLILLFVTCCMAIS